MCCLKLEYNHLLLGWLSSIHTTKPKLEGVHDKNKFHKMHMIVAKSIGAKWLQSLVKCGVLAMHNGTWWCWTTSWLLDATWFLL